MRLKGTMIVSIIIISLLVGCAPKSVKVGFVGDMTSKNSQLAVDIRNAVELGMSEINESGGVKGYQLELVIKDDGNDIDQAIEAHKEFRDEEVQFVIGHITSNMADAVVQSESEELLFLSPTMSTNSLSGIDDYILRTSPINSNQGKALAEFLQKEGINEIVVVHDVMNAEYATNLANKIDFLSEEYGYELVNSIPFDTRTDDLQLISEAVLESGVKDVILISQATDTAFFMQFLKQNNPEVRGISVSWSMTQDLIQNGGKNVQGMEFVGMYKSSSDTSRYIEFVNNFKEDYGYEPSFACVLGYDCIMALARGLEESDDFTPYELKKAMIGISDYEGLQEVFGIDEYGDNNRQYIMHKLVGDEFIPQW